MNPNAKFERDLEQWLQAEAPASAPTGLHAAVIDRARTMRQRPGWATLRLGRWSGRNRGITLFAAGALLLVSGAAAVGSGLLRLPSLVPPGPVPSLAIVPTPSPAAESPSPLISPPTVRPSSWTATGPMLEVRQGGTATLLLDGKVLVAGGLGKQNAPGGWMSPLATAELYDPGTRTWTATGSMTTPRQSSTATLLPDGRVLVAGGDNANGTSAELYDPGSGLWTATGDMITPRWGYTATLLPDGKVLVTGGANGSGSLASAELYDPGSGSWTATGSMTTPRAGHTATLLPDGRVLVAGGNSGTGTSAELYDPGTGPGRPPGA
jgi:WD40 repeat protein